MSTHGLWLSAAGMKVNEHRQTLLANNMANASTTGFKQDLAVVWQRAVESRESAAGATFAHPVLDAMAGGLHVRPTFQSFAQGPIEATGRSLDAAIEGEGFFTVRDGEITRYTRDGQFTINRSGELVLSSGDGRWRVLDDGGRPISLNPEGSEAAIAADGTLRQNGATVAKLGLVTSENKQSFRKTGHNLFELKQGETIPAGGRIVAEAREGSNFEIMTGLANMIEVSRAYQLNANMLQLQDQVTGQAVSTLGRVA